MAVEGEGPTREELEELAEQAGLNQPIRWSPTKLNAQRAGCKPAQLATLQDIVGTTLEALSEAGYESGDCEH